MNYIFSILEIVSYLDRTNTKHKIKKITKKILIAEVPTFNTSKAINSLGGTIKISIPLENPEQQIQKQIIKICNNKINYGINQIESSKSNLTSIENLIKTFCKKNKIKAYHKYPKEKEIPPSKSTNLDLEITLYKNQPYIVSAFFDPKTYEQRDQNRPFFSPLKVTSLRLAKILINLAQPKKQAIILDPFAGLGTILQEAMLMGFKITGSDKRSSTVKKCKSNLRWIKSKYKIKSEYSIYKSDISEISTKIKSADCIVTEPYLGPYLKKLPAETEARKIARELSRLYDNLLKQASKILKKDSKITIIVPTFKTKNNKTIRIGFQSLLRHYGFKIFQPMQNKLIPIEYRLKNSKIRRKIYVLEKFK